MFRRCLIILALIVVLTGCATRQEIRTARVNGVDLAYEIKGQGEPLLMIMGYAGTMDVWDPVLVDRLADHYQLIMFDNRNVGFSSTSSEEVSISLMAKDSIGLLNALGVESAHVFGWSMGTVIAQEMALSHPEKIRKLVLYGAACDGEPVMEALKRFEGLTPKQFAALLFPKEWAEANPDIYAQLPVPASPATPEAIARQHQALSEWPGTADRLPGLDKDVLLVVGEEDFVTPPAQGEKMMGLIQGAWLVRYKGAGHWLMYQTPEGLSSSTIDFLGQDQNLLN